MCSLYWLAVLQEGSYVSKITWMTTGLQSKALDQEERLTSSFKVICLVLVWLCLNWIQQHTDMKTSLLLETIGSEFVILKIAFRCRCKKPQQWGVPGKSRKWVNIFFLRSNYMKERKKRKGNRKQQKYIPLRLGFPLVHKHSY